MRGSGAGARLVRALCADLASFGVVARADSLASRSWTSITFAGERHALRLTIEGARAGEAADALLADLTEREIALPGHFLVDIGVVSDARDADGTQAILGLEALTVQAG